MLEIYLVWVSVYVIAFYFIIIIIAYRTVIAGMSVLYLDNVLNTLYYIKWFNNKVCIIPSSKLKDPIEKKNWILSIDSKQLIKTCIIFSWFSIIQASLVLSKIKFLYILMAYINVLKIIVKLLL